MRQKQEKEVEEDRIAKSAAMTPEERAALEQQEAEHMEHEKRKSKALKQMAKSLSGGKKKKKRGKR